jgi:hypothetical protein
VSAADMREDMFGKALGSVAFTVAQLDRLLEVQCLVRLYQLEGNSEKADVKSRDVAGRIRVEGRNVSEYVYPYHRREVSRALYTLCKEEGLRMT